MKLHFRGAHQLGENSLPSANKNVYPNEDDMRWKIHFGNRFWYNTGISSSFLLFDIEIDTSLSITVLERVWDLRNHQSVLPIITWPSYGLQQLNNKLSKSGPAVGLDLWNDKTLLCITGQNDWRSLTASLDWRLDQGSESDDDDCKNDRKLGKRDV